MNEPFRHPQFLLRLRRIHLLFILILLFIFLSFNCNTTQPPPDTGALTLSVEDASCIEAWINLKAENISLPVAVTLKQTENNGEEKVRQVINLTTADTLLYVDSLLPKRNYKFKAEWINNSGKLKTAEAAVVTMDTTSHNFTFETFTFGQHSSSVLYDVAIINENNIWAVGEIYMNDSLGNPDPHAYNAVHWDGSEWNLKKLTFYSFCPQGTGSGSYPARSIFAFDNENIVVSSGSQVAYLKNGVQIKKECVPVSINKIWGVSVDDFYIVGYGGGIAHWDGSSWKKIESGTTVRLNDIWGVSQRRTGDDLVLVAASEKYIASETKILSIKNNSVIETLQWTMQDRSIHSIWFDQHLSIFTAGDGVFQSSIEGMWKEMVLPLIFTNRIRGNASNDLITGGDFGIVAHYDGMAWKVFDKLKLVNGNYESVAIKGDVVIANGWDGRRAYIAFGRR